MKKILVLLVTLLPILAVAQNNENPDQSDSNPFVKRTTLEAGVTLSTNGGMTAIGLNGMQYWGFGKKQRRFKVGVGLRNTSSFGSDGLEYITAPADLTSDEANIDTLSLSGTQVNALNLFLALRYDATERWGVEFNIDLAGISYGGEKDGTLQFRGTDNATKATPTAGNVLLVGDNDIGSVNSEFMVTYRYKSNWRFKAGAVFLFNEYSIDPVYRYTNSAGKVLETERYRTKQMTFGVGVNYVF